MLVDKKELETLLEGILFAAGDPVKVSRIAEVLCLQEDDILNCARELDGSYKFERRGIRIVTLADSLQMVSAPEAAEAIRAVIETKKPPKLSQAAMEVLSIIAWYQPVTRAGIEQIRGVDSSYTVSMLCDRGLIEETGHLEAPGRPAVLGTTDAFLRVFGLQSLGDLPTLPQPGQPEPELFSEAGSKEQQ